MAASSILHSSPSVPTTRRAHADTLLGALECLRSGMTTVQDMLTLYPYEDRHMDAVMAAYDKVGFLPEAGHVAGLPEVATP